MNCLSLLFVLSLSLTQIVKCQPLNDTNDTNDTNTTNGLSFLIFMEGENIVGVLKDVDVNGELVTLTCFEDIPLIEYESQLYLGAASDCIDVHYFENHEDNYGMVFWSQTLFNFDNATSALQKGLVTVQPILVPFVNPDIILDFTHITGSFPTYDNFAGNDIFSCYTGTVTLYGSLNMENFSLSSNGSINGSLTYSYIWLFDLIFNDNEDNCIWSNNSMIINNTLLL